MTLTNLTYLTTMIMPQTEGGNQLKMAYDKKIENVEKDPKGYPRSGPNSKAGIVNSLRQEFNTKLAEIEEVSPEQLIEASRPQMNEPKTEGGKQLKTSYDTKISAVENGVGDTTEIYQEVNSLRQKYNDLLAEIES